MSEEGQPKSRSFKVAQEQQEVPSAFDVVRATGRHETRRVASLIGILSGHAWWGMLLYVPLTLVIQVMVMLTAFGLGSDFGISWAQTGALSGAIVLGGPVVTFLKRMYWGS